MTFGSNISMMNIGLIKLSLGDWPKVGLGQPSSTLKAHCSNLTSKSNDYFDLLNHLFTYVYVEIELSLQSFVY